MRYARDLRPDDFKTGNVILLGSREADPWIELYERNMNFVLNNDYKMVFTVLNRSPRRGEPTQWESRRDDPERRVYGVVAYLRSFTGDGNVLLLEGTGMSGTEAGMDFVLDDAQLLPFLDQIRRPAAFRDPSRNAQYGVERSAESHRLLAHNEVNWL